MVKSAAEPSFVVTVHMSKGRKATQPVHTAKAALHYAKSMCNNGNVVRVTLAGPDGTSELYVR